MKQWNIVVAKSKEQIRIELQALVQKGIEIHGIKWHSKSKTSQSKKEIPKEDAEPIQMSYQKWYTKALSVVRQLFPERYSEFQDQYKIDKC
jgi:ribosomal protein S19E (S16A)